MVAHLLGAQGPVLAVSPHLDDAVLSAGATLAALVAAGRPVTVLTVFAGDPGPALSPVAERHHARCGLGVDAMERRRAEDRAALTRLGADPRHGALGDAVYRRRTDGGWVCTEEGELFDPPPPDPALDDAVTELVGQALEETRSGLLLGPAGVGGHVDHVLVARAVARCARERLVPSWRWRDQPYTLSSGAVPEDPGGVLVPYTPGSLAAKLAAVGCYASQVPMLWPGGTDWRGLLSASGPPWEPGEEFEPHPAAN